MEDEHLLSYKKPQGIKIPWIVGPLTIKSKEALSAIERMLREMGFSMEDSVNYDPHHIISNRRQVNKNKRFEHFEVVGLSEAANWIDYPNDSNDGDDMQEDSLSPAPRGYPPQQDICSYPYHSIG